MHARLSLLLVGAAGALAHCTCADTLDTDREAEDVGEGEGEGDVGEGEGEGEGDVGEGEGEGEGDVGEGEGEGEGDFDVGTCDPDFGVDEACGGDLAGLWILSGACVADIVDDGVAAVCPAAVFGTSTFDGSGSMLVSPGSTSGSIEGRVLTPITVPPSCLAGGADCADIAAAADAPVTCVDGVGENVGGCDCVSGFDADLDLDGDGEAADGVVVVDGGDVGYCTDRTSLQLRRFNGDDREPTYLLTFSNGG